MTYELKFISAYKRAYKRLQKCGIDQGVLTLTLVDMGTHAEILGCGVSHAARALKS